MSNDDLIPHQLPIPDLQHPGLITYDAKDPDTQFPPITGRAAAQGRAERPA